MDHSYIIHIDHPVHFPFIPFLIPRYFVTVLPSLYITFPPRLRLDLPSAPSDPSKALLSRTPNFLFVSCFSSSHAATPVIAAFCFSLLSFSWTYCVAVHLAAAQHVQQWQAVDIVICTSSPAMKYVLTFAWHI